MNSNNEFDDTYFWQIILFEFIIFASQICYENINKPLDGPYLADFGIDITRKLSQYPYQVSSLKNYWDIRSQDLHTFYVFLDFAISPL